MIDMHDSTNQEFPNYLCFPCLDFDHILSKLSQWHSSNVKGNIKTTISVFTDTCLHFNQFLVGKYHKSIVRSNFLHPVCMLSAWSCWYCATFIYFFKFMLCIDLVFFVVSLLTDFFLGGGSHIQITNLIAMISFIICLLCFF